ncbi:ABC transporter ATP-binding protein [Salegentibacter sediminis]|uniref:ABC transporter ATP-binding protein n=1 Tax=Salegentibacter sediminis TaxID=1930251 RepID=UPI0009C06D83|nr:ABC transporter ATP-binding protein [Salegentibacter sediminis]
MLKLKNVSFAYLEKPILKNVNFSLEKGKNLSVIGESGCGKSTLLKLIYGLLHTDGKILWDNKELLGPQFNIVPGEAFIKYLAQDFDLMPPLTVAENIGKHLSNMYPRKKKQRVRELMEVVEMTELANEKAKHLSGGQQQRVALARALANEPELLLLDEPFSHIDHFRKNNLRRQLFSYLAEKNITCIVATHDSTDALSFADKTIVLKNAKIHAEGTPEELYQNPPNKYVASLFGEINEIMLKNLIPEEKSRKKILVYPHEISFSKKSDIKVEVKENFFRGQHYLIKARLKGQEIFIENPSALKLGTITGINVSSRLIDARK